MDGRLGSKYVSKNIEIFRMELSLGKSSQSLQRIAFLVWFSLLIMLLIQRYILFAKAFAKNHVIKNLKWIFWQIRRSVDSRLECFCDFLLKTYLFIYYLVKGLFFNCLVRCKLPEITTIDSLGSFLFALILSSH